MQFITRLLICRKVPIECRPLKLWGTNYIKDIGVGFMISNQILQSTIDGLKNITRKDMSVVEKEGKVIATTEENMIGRQIDAIENFVGSQAYSSLFSVISISRFMITVFRNMLYRLRAKTRTVTESARLPLSRFKAFLLHTRKDTIRITLSKTCCWITCFWWTFTAGRRSSIFRWMRSELS